MNYDEVEDDVSIRDEYQILRRIANKHYLGRQSSALAPKFSIV